MNNKGFTLIELIATIALLAVVAIISFVSINNILVESDIKDCESLVSNITTAAKEYVSDNRYGTISTNFTAKDLINGKYLDGPIVDPFDNSVEINAENIKINVELNADYTAKNINIKNSSGNVIDCKNIDIFKYESGTGSGAMGGGSTKNIVLDDRKTGTCASAIDYFYSDGSYRYYFTCQKSNFVYVIVDGEEYLLKDALNNKIVTIAELEDAGYTFLKEVFNVATS